MSTLNAPLIIGAPQPDTSPRRSAGRPPISTVRLPLGNGVGGCGPATGGMAQACRSPAAAAGRLPINTLATPGPPTTPGCAVGSVTRAAGGIADLLVNLHHPGINGAQHARADIRCWGLNLYICCTQYGNRRG